MNSWSVTDNQGFSLIELMLSVAIAMLLFAGAASLLTQTSKASITAGNLADLNERATYVLALLEDDIRLAGYWGLHSQGENVNNPGGISIVCSNTDVSAWALRTDAAFEVINNGPGLPCPAYSATINTSDILVIRHASPTTVEPRNRSVQLASSHQRSVFFDDGSPPDLDPPTAIHDLNVHAWYLDQQSSEGTLPALRRYTLVHNGLLQNQEIMPGIEKLEVLLGIDEDDDGLVDNFVSSELAADQRVLALRLRISVRSLKPEPGKSPEYPASYRRLNVERTIPLNNLLSG